MAQTAKIKLESDSKSSKSAKMKPSYKHVPHSQKPAHLVAKRNARERRRVQAVNQAFYKLRKCVPFENRNKRVSKVKTLQRAIEHIRKLERILAEDEDDQQQQQQLSVNLATPVNQQTQADSAVRRTKKSSNNCDQVNLDIAPNQQQVKQKRTRIKNQPEQVSNCPTEVQVDPPTVYQAPIVETSKYQVSDATYYSSENIQYSQQGSANELVLRESSAYNQNLNYYNQESYQVSYLNDNQPHLESVYALNYQSNFYQQPHIGYLEGNNHHQYAHEPINSWQSTITTGKSTSVVAADSSTTSFALLQSPSSSSSSSSSSSVANIKSNNNNNRESDNSSANSTSTLNKQQVSGYLSAYAVNRTQTRVPSHLSTYDSNHYQQPLNGRKTSDELAMNGQQQHHHHQVRHLAADEQLQLQLSTNSNQEEQYHFHNHHHQPQMHQQSFLSNHTNHLSAPNSSNNNQQTAANNSLLQQDYTSLPL